MIIKALTPLLFSSLMLANMPEWVDPEVKQINEEVIALRHYFHQNPELGNQEKNTQAKIIEALKSYGIEVQTNWKNAPSAVIGILNPQKNNTIALRADMDALPIKENTNLAYASKKEGLYHGQKTFVSHMCGHDAHMAMLLGAAKIMAKHKDKINHRVIFIFQPAEEGDSLHDPFSTQDAPSSGAKALVEDGLIEKYQIKHVFGIHVMANLKAGEILIREGITLNSADGFKAEIIGKQSHGAMPQNGVDAILIAANAITSMQQIVSRNIDLTKGMGVITVGKLTAGEAPNVMSGYAEFLGTIRSNNPDIRETLLKRIPEVINHTASAAGGAAKVKIIRFYPVTYNDPKLANWAVKSLKSWNLNASISDWNPGASEDFSFYAQKVPSVFMFLGIDHPDQKDIANNHSDKFIIDDSALSTGVKMHLNMILSQ